MKKRVVKSDRSGEIRWGGGRGGGLFIDQARAFVLEHGPRFNSRLTNLSNGIAIIVEGPNMTILSRCSIGEIER